MRAIRLLLPALLLLPVAACDDGGSAGGASAAVDVDPGDGVDDTSGATDEPDAAPPDAGPADDTAAPPDTEEPPWVGPLARVFPHDPVTDEFQTAEVVLVPPTDPNGRLIGAAVDVRNCGWGGVFQLCEGGYKALPGEDGHYSHIKPPATYNDGFDPFSELMMYHHVNVMHDYYKNVHGLTDLDYPIPALVNLDFGVPNAAYIPAEGLQQFGLPAQAGGAIVFFQYEFTDFAYDASVIYHEYTHAMVGTTRLSGGLADQVGIDNLPGAMNEGFADYFAASVAGDPVIGNFALESLAQLGQNLRRDLTEKRSCPDDLFGEVHADGKIVGSALWAIRAELGRDVTDGIILRALQSFTNFTNLEMAGQLVLAEAKKVGVAEGEVVEQVLVEHGLIGCERAKEWTSFSALSNGEGLPYMMAGRQTVGGAALPDGVPGYFQFFLEVPPGKTAVTLTWSAQTASGFFGPGGPASLDLALKKGGTVTFGTLTGQILADHKVPGANLPGNANTQGVTLTGACLPKAGERLYVMLVNKGNQGANIITMDRTWRDGPDGAPNEVTCP